MLDIIVQTRRKHMRYPYEVKKDGQYTITSTDFPDIAGKGSTEDKAFSIFLTNVFKHIKTCFKNDLPIPEGYKGAAKRKTFGMPLNMTLKIKLHNSRLLKQVSRTELAAFLAVTYEELPTGDWDLQVLKSIKPKNLPKYKNVQRLFDIDHDSTVKEIEQAYRVLGYSVDVCPYERN